jgi:Lon-like ATP-dependent protease
VGGKQRAVCSQAGEGHSPAPQVGLVNGMAVYGPNMGTLIEVEAAAIPVDAGKGQIVVTGIMEEEEMGGYGRTMRRKSMAKSSMENVITVLQAEFSPASPGL